MDRPIDVGLATATTATLRCVLIKHHSVTQHATHSHLLRRFIIHGAQADITEKKSPLATKI
jgi:hypothetical protein